MESYNKLIEQYGLELAEKAGYITPSECKDIQSAQKNSPETNNYTLLTTGCFSPLHEGHIHMMNEAKKWLEDRGDVVDYGAFILAHQSYIDEKHGRHTLEERQFLAQELVGDYTWLHVDVRANLYYTHDTNFTQLMTELYPQCKKQAYVFGSDRYEFGYIALTDERLYICVIRDPQDIDKVEKLYHQLNLNNLVYIIPKTINEMSSTDQYKHRTLPAARQIKHLAIRDDGIYGKSSSYHTAYEQFKSDLEHAFRICSTFTKITWVNVDQQLKDIPKFNNTVISLDKYYTGDIQLNISRYFDLYGQQKKAADLVMSTVQDEEILETPLQLSLPKDQYVLIDDDSVSGYTMERLSSEIDKIVSTHTLMEPIYDDVVDARDFLFGAKYGGLLCKQPNGLLKRYPYVWPEVNLYYRASIELNKQKQFSELIYKANERFARAVERLTHES